MKQFSYDESLTEIYNHIPVKMEPDTRAGFGSERVKYLLSLLDSPQEKFKSIHIAGTSGKGSTAIIISQILSKQGLKTGLTTSPHIMDIRERVQINNQLISKKRFAELFSLIHPKLIEMKKTKYGELSYFEIMVAMSFFTFSEEQVDYAIIETGMGGIYDRTNCIDRQDKLAIITKIGLDHTHILGNTVEEIAARKSGIITTNGTVIFLSQKESINQEFIKFADDVNAEKFPLKENENFGRIEKGEFWFKFLDLNNSFKTNLIADFQLENISLALAGVHLLAKRDHFKLSLKSLSATIANIELIGRFDVVYLGTKTLIIDGAHNPQKMQSLIYSLKKTFPNQKYSFLVAFKEGKDYTKMLDLVIPVSSEINVTTFKTSDQDMSNLSIKPEKIIDYLQEQNFNNYKIDKSAKRFLTHYEGSKSNVIVVTGSIYLLDDIYHHLEDKLP